MRRAAAAVCLVALAACGSAATDAPKEWSETKTVFRDPDSFFQMYAHLSDEEAVATARMIWREINGKNLVENIEPTKSRASLILEKGHDHRVTNVQFRRL